MKHLKQVMTIEYNASTDTYLCSDGTFTGEYNSLQEVFDIDDSDYFESLENECKQYKQEYEKKSNK